MELPMGTTLFWRLYYGQPGLGTPVTGHYSPYLVLLSVVVAAVAGLAMLTIFDRISLAENRTKKRRWLITGAFVMGSGVWAMHFTGMLALQLPFNVKYDLFLTCLSVLPAILGSGLAIKFMTRNPETINWWMIHLGALPMSLGIGAMHYVGMEAMTMPTDLRYDIVLFVLSLIVAHLMALVALHVKFFAEQKSESVTTDLKYQLPAAVFIGLAVSGMHYTAMFASTFYPDPSLMTDSDLNYSAKAMGTTIVVFTSVGMISLILAIKTTLMKEIQETEKRFYDLTYNVNDAIISINDRGNIILWNETAEELFGYREDEISGESLAFIVPEQYRDVLKEEGFQEFLERHARKQLGDLFELEMLDNHGNTFPVEVTTCTWDKKNETFLTAFIRDITARKTYEQELEQARNNALDAKQEAEKANRAKSEFLARMSHEIRTPLNAVIGMTNLLKKTDLNEEQKEYVRISKQSSNALMNLITDILNLSKVESGDVELQEAPFHLEPFVNETVSCFTRNAHEKGLDLHVFVDGDCAATVIGDENRLQQILINLVNNAIKFTNSGEIVINVEPKREFDNRQVIQFEVKDTGIGISREKQNQIFERFSQANESISNQFGGSGLGLSICKNLVELMNGTIDVESEVEEGSTFRFEIPMELAEETLESDLIRRVAAAPFRADFSGLRMLVVEHSSTGQSILRTMLETWGASTNVCSNGTDALEHIRYAIENDDPYDLFLIDRALPDSDGFQLIEQIKTRARVSADQIILMLSTEHLMDDRKRAKNIGLGTYLVKPVDWSSLRKSIQQVIGEAPEPRDEKGDRPNSPEEITFESTPNILIAEDNEYNRKLLKAILKSYPVECAFAEDGVQALKKAKSGTYDIIFMDMKMPEMDGLATTKAFRTWEAEQDRPRTPVIALTAQALKEHREEALTSGCDAHLSKPISEERFIRTLRTYVQSPDVQNVQEETDPPQPPPSNTQDSPGNKQELNIDERFESFVPDFMNNIDDQMDRIQEHAEQEEYEDIADLAHDVKGASGSYGFEHVQNMAEEIESLARDQQLNGIPSRAQDIQEHLDQLTVTYV